jgi:hypothetical protein
MRWTGHVAYIGVMINAYTFFLSENLEGENQVGGTGIDGSKSKKKKVKSLGLTKYPAVKAYWGMEVLVPRFLNFGTGWRWVVSSYPGRFTPGYKVPPVSLEVKAGWAAESVWTRWRRGGAD